MKLVSQSIADGAPIASPFAFARIDPVRHVTLSDNRSPHLAWSDVPANTRSFAIVCVDADAPSRPDDVNQEGREVPDTLERVDFHHWVLIDLPADTRELAEGEFSHQVTPKGKSGPEAPREARQGTNDYTSWFASDQDMRGDYYGYDGPCPPWNDSIVHHYTFTVYALDVDRLPLEGKFDGGQALGVIREHTLGQASITGTYTLNPRLVGEHG